MCSSVCHIMANWSTWCNEASACRLPKIQWRLGSTKVPVLFVQLSFSRLSASCAVTFRQYSLLQTLATFCWLAEVKIITFVCGAFPHETDFLMKVNRETNWDWKRTASLLLFKVCFLLFFFSHCFVGLLVGMANYLLPISAEGTLESRLNLDLVQRIGMSVKTKMWKKQWH